MNHLFIMYQKIIQMAISFKINIVVSMLASLLFIVLVLLFYEKHLFCSALGPRLHRLVDWWIDPDTCLPYIECSVGMM